MNRRTEAVTLPERLLSILGDTSAEAGGTPSVLGGTSRNMRRLIDAIQESGIDLSEGATAQEIAAILADTLRQGRSSLRGL